MPAYSIKFINSGIEAIADGELTLLEIAEKNGIAIPSSCKEGWCSECKVICKGEVEAGKKCRIEESYKKEGYVYTCCTKPKSDLELEL
jgi:ferredoxin